MTCASYEKVLLLESERFSIEDVRALEQHVLGCEECAGGLDAIRTARRAGRSHAAVLPTAASRAKIWDAVEPRRTFFTTWRLPALAAATTLAGVLLFLRPAEEQPQPQIAVQPPPPPQEKRMSIAGGSIVLSKSARVVVQGDADLTEIILTSGDIEIELEEGKAVDVVTADARVKVIGGKARISERGVEVAHGTANVWAKRSLLPQSLRAGERIELARPAPQQQQNMAATLQEAKAALPNDAPRAAVLAERVLDVVAKTTQLEAEALVILADAERRRGRLTESAELYARVAIHPEGRSFAEESLLQRALILARTSTKDAVLEQLAAAEARFPDGATAPERAALAAEMWLAKNDPLAAAQAIERANGAGRSLKLLQRRVEVARALLSADLAHRPRARALLTPALDGATPVALRRDAEALMKK